MTTEGTSPKSPGEGGPRGREPLTPVVKRRLASAFEHANKQIAQDNYDYATELLMQCVLGDPSSLDYVRTYIENLQKKYKNNRKGAPLARFRERGARSAVKKAEAHEQWDEVIRHGLKVLTVNPWDAPTLRSMATASQHSGDRDPEWFYLKCALEGNIKDWETNIQAAKALAVRGQFDGAVACLHRVEQARPDDQEVQRLINDFVLRKTMRDGKWEDDTSKFKGAKGGAPQPDQQLSDELVLRQKIAQEPKNLANYLELSQSQINREDYRGAEEILAKAFEVSGGDNDIRDRWEDVQMRLLRQELTAVKKQRDAGEPGSEEHYKRLRRDLNDKELAVYENRCQRYPNNLAFKFDLGQRYQIGGQTQEAIKQFQIARNDPRRKGVCMLALGQCFQQIKQHRLAMGHFEAAIQDIPDRDGDNKKQALYQAGRLAYHLRDFAAAEKHLTALAELDFGYRDVAALLDKIAKARESEGGEAPPEEPKDDDTDIVPGEE